MTNEQNEMINLKWQQMPADNRPTFEEFKSSAAPTIGMNGAVVLNWCGMWLVIETDGHAHS